MYWNMGYSVEETTAVLININMRCIEMGYDDNYQTQEDRLTLTWDVLKCNMADKLEKSERININMRCIEIEQCQKEQKRHYD